MNITVTRRNGYWWVGGKGYSIRFSTLDAAVHYLKFIHPKPIGANYARVHVWA